MFLSMASFHFNCPYCISRRAGRFPTLIIKQKYSQKSTHFSGAEAAIMRCVIQAGLGNAWRTYRREKKLPALFTRAGSFCYLHNDWLYFYSTRIIFFIAVKVPAEIL